MTKWICIKDTKELKQGDIVDGSIIKLIDDPGDEIFYYIYNGNKNPFRFHRLFFKELAEFREQQIKSVIDQ